MSFLYEKENFIKITSELLKKEAQIASNQLAKKLVNNLSAQFSDVSSESNTPVDLKLENLQSIGKLMQFLIVNKINFQGTRIAYSEEEVNNLTENIRDTLVPVSINISRDAATRQWNQADFYVNLNSLVGYVAYLQQKSNQENNPILKVMIGKLIDQVNQIKPDSGLTRTPKSTLTNTNELPNETVVDSFGSKVFDIKNPFADKGSLTLTAKDIKDKNSLNNWLQQNPEAQVAIYDSSNNRHLFRYTDPSINLSEAWNNIVNTISSRANRLLQLSKSPEESNKYNFYNIKVNNLGGSVTTEHKIENKEKTTPSTSSNISQTLNQALSALPLSIREINLDDIQTFFRLIEQVFTGERANRLKAYIADADNKISVLKRMMRYSDSIYPLGVQPQQFASRLKQPTTSYLAALDRLTEIVDLTRQVMAEVYSAYGRQIAESNSNQNAILLGQIGRNRSDNSVYSRNIEDLQELKSGINQVAKVV